MEGRELGGFVCVLAFLYRGLVLRLGTRVVFSVRTIFLFACI